MSWYSDGEKFDEYDDPYCIWRKCEGGESKEECERCLARAYGEERSEEE